MSNKNNRVYIVPKGYFNKRQNNVISQSIDAIKSFISGGLNYGYNTFVDPALQYVADNWNATKQSIDDNIITPIANKLEQTKTVAPADWYMTDSEDDYVPFATDYYKKHRSPIKEGNVVISGKDMAQHQINQGLSMLAGFSAPTSVGSATMLGAGIALPYAVDYANQNNLFGSDLNKQQLYTDLAMMLPVGRIKNVGTIATQAQRRLKVPFTIQSPNSISNLVTHPISPRRANILSDNDINTLLTPLSTQSKANELNKALYEYNKINNFSSTKQMRFANRKKELQIKIQNLKKELNNPSATELYNINKQLSYLESLPNDQKLRLKNREIKLRNRAFTLSKKLNRKKEITLNNTVNANNNASSVNLQSNNSEHITAPYRPPVPTQAPELIGVGKRAKKRQQLEQIEQQKKEQQQLNSLSKSIIQVTDALQDKKIKRYLFKQKEPLRIAKTQYPLSKHISSDVKKDIKLSELLLPKRFRNKIDSEAYSKGTYDFESSQLNTLHRIQNFYDSRPISWIRHNPKTAKYILGAGAISTIPIINWDTSTTNNTTRPPLNAEYPTSSNTTVPPTITSTDTARVSNRDTTSISRKDTVRTNRTDTTSNKNYVNANTKQDTATVNRNNNRNSSNNSSNNSNNGSSGDKNNTSSSKTNEEFTKDTNNTNTQNTTKTKKKSKKQRRKEDEQQAKLAQLRQAMAEANSKVLDDVDKEMYYYGRRGSVYMGNRYII